MTRIDRRRKGILVLECDINKLASDGLLSGEELCSRVKAGFPNNPIKLIQSDTQADLLESLGNLTNEGLRFGTIVLIGHSNSRGLKISADRFTDWDELTNWISPFSPKRIVLLACEAGKWFPCADLFDGIAELNEIYASPTLTYKNQKDVVFAIILYILGAKKVKSELFRLIQLLNLFLLKGLMLRYTRSEYERSDEEDELLWTDFAEPFLEKLMNDLRR